MYASEFTKLGMTQCDESALGSSELAFGCETSINLLEASDCLDQTLNRLKTINFMYVERSRPLFLFINLSLDHSPTLEKISIRPSVTTDTLEKYNFAKDVMPFPRASSKVELLYLDP